LTASFYQLQSNIPIFLAYFWLAEHSGDFSGVSANKNADANSAKWPSTKAFNHNPAYVRFQQLSNHDKISGLSKTMHESANKQCYTHRPKTLSATHIIIQKMEQKTQLINY